MRLTTRSCLVFLRCFPRLVRSPEYGFQGIGALAVGFAFDVVVAVGDVVGIVPFDPFDSEPGVTYVTVGSISPVPAIVTVGNSPDGPVETADCRFLSVSSMGCNNRPRNKGMVVWVGLVFVFCLSDNFDIVETANSCKVGVACGKVCDLSAVHE